MITHFRRLRQFYFVSAAAGLLAIFAAADRVAAQGLGYGVTANGTLFRFDLSDPDLSDAGSSTEIGNLGFLPEGIDFRPTTTAGDPNRPLYAIDVGVATTQLYTINTSSGFPTAVGAGFPSTVAGSYDLTGNKRFGFDFNPTTLQGDGSIRIRLIADNGGVNLRLNSDTGLVAAVDTPLFIPPTDSPFADGAAYINSNKAVLPANGTTALYDMDSRNDALYKQDPPNAGQLNFVGTFGSTPGSFDASSGIAFDILTDAGDADSTIGGDKAYAALKRSATANGAYLLYKVDLATGLTTQGVLVDGGREFTGGLALTYTAVPEPGTAPAALTVCTVGASVRRNQRRRAA